MSVYDSNDLRKLQSVEVEILEEITRILSKMVYQVFFNWWNIIGGGTS